MDQDYYEFIIKNVDSKINCLTEIAKVVERQEQNRYVNESDIDLFDHYINSKEKLTQDLNQLNFEFEHFMIEHATLVQDYLKNNVNESIDMKDRLTKISNLMIIIQDLELKCKKNLDDYIKNENQKIKNFRTSNQMILNYSKSMMGHGGSEAYFMDNRK